MDYAELITKIYQQASSLVKENIITKDTTYYQMSKFFVLFVTTEPVNTIFIDKFNEACYNYLRIYNKI